MSTRAGLSRATPAGGNKTRSAQILNIGRKTLYGNLARMHL